MINIVGATLISLPVILIEWEPRDWSNRKSWGPDTIDGFYMTKAGEIYRLSGELVIYVTQEQLLH